MLASRIGTILVLGELFLLTASSPSPWWVPSVPFRPINLTSSSDVFWVCGADEMIAKSDDGGRTWTVKHQKADGELLLSIVFVDGLHGFAAGSNGAFLRTTDGGDTWTSNSFGTSTIKSIATVPIRLCRTSFSCRRAAIAHQVSETGTRNPHQWTCRGMISNCFQ
jgi:hypothetical protein